MNIDFQTTTKKDLFKAKLNGEELDFGLVAKEDYVDLVKAAISLDLLRFFFQKEYRGILAYLRVCGDFSFSIQDWSAGSTRGWVKQIDFEDGDFIEFTEILLTNDYEFEHLKGHEPNLPKKHSLFVDFENGQRAKVYRKYNFEV